MSEHEQVERQPTGDQQSDLPQRLPSKKGLEIEEDENSRLERLGRQRPEKLGSLWQEIGFVFSIIMAQALTEFFVSGFTVLLPTVADELHIPAASTTWPASAFSLVVSSFLIPFGRLSDIYGGFPMYIIGCTWYCIWSLIGGFAQNELMLDFCRAIQGLGPAAYLPASLTLLGNMYRPGPRKNMVFSLYGAMAVVGFFMGIFFAGVCGQYATWRWYFWIGAILIFITTVTAYFTIPSDVAEHKNSEAKMDWLGTISTSSGLILFVFAITASAHAPQGWKTPYILVTFLASIVIFGIAFYIEGWIASQPLLPFEVFKIKYMRPFILGLVFAYGTLGIYLLYATLYIENIMGVSPMLLVAWYLPTAIGGTILAAVGGLVLHLIPGTYLCLITSVAIIIESLLFALAPENAGYWAWIFPAMVCCTISIDLIFNATNIFLSTALPSRQQGLAGALANVLLQLSIAVMLGFAEIVASGTAYQGEKQSYKNVFWFELACGAASLVVFAGFVRIGRAKSALTADEKEAKAAAAQQETS